VLGGRGYIGRHLVRHLQSQGHYVLVPQRDSVELFENPLGNVIYSIGLTADFRRRPFDTVEAHVGYLSRVLQHANFDSLLYLSSTRVYEGCGRGDEAASLVVRACEPGDLYNLSKLMGESIALNCGRQQVRVARVSNVVGGEQPSDSFVQSIVRDARAGAIVLRSSLDTKKDYLHINDAVTMIAAVASYGKQTLYNIASGESLEHRAWVSALQQRFGCSVSVASGATKIFFPEISVMRFQEEFNIKPGPAIRVIKELA
jgi:nucleoside-diphosphate-sugar epimerase